MVSIEWNSERCDQAVHERVRLAPRMVDEIPRQVYKTDGTAVDS